MKLKDTWFTKLCLALFICGGSYTIISAFSRYGQTSQYPSLVKGCMFFLLVGAIVAVYAISKIAVSVRIKFGLKPTKYTNFLIGAIGVAILVSSFIVRVVYVNNYPMEPASDYKTYYEVALLLQQGTLIEQGVGYCQYIAMFPHAIGYSYALAIVMNIFGSSVWVCQMFNVVCAVATCFFVWQIATMVAGKVSGLIALFITAFWPSQIIYNNMLASEYLFSCLLFMSLWLFVFITKRYTAKNGQAVIGVLLHVAVGVLIGLTSVIRPMALLLLIAVLLCLVACKMPLAILHRNDLSLSLRMLEKGWLRALIILAAYMVTSNFFGMYTAYNIGQEPASGVSSYGYNLLVGVNQESIGSWNQEDSEFLFEQFDKTGDATLAQQACLEKAIERIKENPVGLVDLAFNKFTTLWSNDDYGTSWNLLFLDQQGNLTNERQEFLLLAQDFNNIWYAITLLFATLSALYMLRRKPNWACVPLIVYLGTVAMHLTVESQNRYHFHALYIFAILAAVGMNYVYEDSIVFNEYARTKKVLIADLKQKETEALQRVNEADLYIEQKTKDSMQNKFDMAKAINDGNIKVSVSKIYEEE